MNTEYDMVFLHPPLSFNKIDYPLSGIFESNTGTGDMLTMAPIGLVGLAGVLGKAGYRTKVFNIAKVFQKQREDPGVDVWEYIKNIKSRVFGISLHWSVHAPGAVELARRIKKLNPESHVVFGGLSSTYFHEELLTDYPFIDAVVLGECEHVIADILNSLLSGQKDLSDLRNIAFRKNGKVEKTEVTMPVDFTAADFYPAGEIVEPKPEKFDRESILRGYTLVRGCDRNCLFCGGSKFSYKRFFFRDTPSPPGIEHFSRYLHDMTKHGARVLRLYGDTRTFGSKYDEQMRQAIKDSGAEIDVAMEVFFLPTYDYLKAWKDVCSSMVCIFSPESTYSDLRQMHGKRYSNEEILEFGQWCDELDIHLVFCLMYAMPGHTGENIPGELGFYEEIVKNFPNASMMFQPYLYLDPGCEIHTNPEKFDTKILFKNLRDIINGLTRPYWYYSIGYEQGDLNRDGIFNVILEVASEKARLYHRHNRLSASNLLRTYENIRCQKKISSYIKENNPADEELNHFIRKNLPSYLRKSNANLISRPFMGHILQKHMDTAAAVFEAFTLVLEVMTLHGIIDTETFLDMLESFRKEHLSEPSLDILLLEKEFSEFFRSVAGPVKVSFLEDLVRFEWQLYVYHYRKDQTVKKAVSFTTGYNFDSIEDFLYGTYMEDGVLDAPRAETGYTFTHDDVTSSVDGQKRVLNIFNRRTYRMENALKRLFKSQLGIDCDRAYSVVGG